MAHWESKHPYKKPYSLGNAAESGQLLQVRCRACRRTVYYLASDLLEFFPADRPALEPPFTCSKCGEQTYIRVTVHSPLPADVGRLQVRRPAEVVHIQKWRTVPLGNAVRPPEPMSAEELLRLNNEEAERQAARAYQPPSASKPTESEEP